MELIIRNALDILLGILALKCFRGRILWNAWAKDIPVALLSDSPFKNYFISSLFLFLIAGGSALYLPALQYFVGSVSSHGS